MHAVIEQVNGDVAYGGSAWRFTHDMAEHQRGEQIKQRQDEQGGKQFAKKTKHKNTG